MESRHSLWLFSILILICSIQSFGKPVTDNQFSPADSSIRLNEISVTSMKQGNNLQKQAIASTIIGRKNIEKLNILSLRGVSEFAPNFYVPEYGSRMTSSIYVRGLGARIDQPVVGLNVDNVPILNKDNYDFDMVDIERIEMLRGPQSTLFGRNTMGGLINIYTLSPFSYQGLRLVGEYGSANSYKASASYYTLLSDKLAMAFIGQYFSTDGFYDNMYNHKKCDWEHQWGGRWKTQWRPTTNFNIDNSFSFSISRQGGYPYEYVKTKEINYNDTCFYRRNAITDGLSMKWDLNDVHLSSITSYQYLDDNMTLDQDFLPVSYFTLSQKRKEHSFTQDFIAKGKSRNHYNWLAGIFGFYKHTNMDAPVLFKDKGISQLIEYNRNEINPDYPVAWDSREFPLNSKFKNTSYGLAAYHQSNITYRRWDFTIGLRFDYEKSSLQYNSNCNSGYTTYHIVEGQEPVVFRHDDVIINDNDKLHKSFFEILPKFSALYNLPMESPSNLYASVAKGYKAGGFNTQMFSDVLQQKIMGIMGISSKYDVADIVTYKPEKSWTYEVGAHIECLDRKIQTDLSVFYIDCRDQQLTIFPDGNTTGRIMTNAGHSRSYGGEFALKARPIQQLEINASYGYTNAKFIEFNNGKENYKGNFVPYAPQNTMFVGGTYTFNFSKCWLEAIVLDANVKGVGRIYWDEANSIYQPFYAQLGTSLTLKHKNYSLQIWGYNITNTNFDTFYFVSIGNAFLQKGKPHQFGATLRINIL